MIQFSGTLYCITALQMHHAKLYARSRNMRHVISLRHNKRRYNALYYIMLKYFELYVTILHMFQMHAALQSLFPTLYADS